LCTHVYESTNNDRLVYECFSQKVKHVVDVQLARCSSSYDTYMYMVRYKDQFGFILRDRPVIIDDIRIRALAKSAMKIDRTREQRPTNKPLKECKVSR
jgi:hypothetical protein